MHTLWDFLRFHALTAATFGFVKGGSDVDPSKVQSFYSHKPGTPIPTRQTWRSRIMTCKRSCSEKLLEGGLLSSAKATLRRGFVGILATATAIFVARTSGLLEKRFCVRQARGEVALCTNLSSRSKLQFCKKHRKRCCLPQLHCLSLL